MSRIKQLLCLGAPVAMLMMVGCDGDDGPPNKFCGHGCTMDDPINLDEGGEVRLEVLRRQNGLGFEVRTSAWFASAQTPGSRPLFRDPATWQDNVANPCTDMRDKKKFPNGLPDSRTYVDVGNSVTISGGARPLVLERVEMLQDYAFQNIFDLGYHATPDPETLTYGAEYDVDLAGSSEAAALKVTNAMMFQKLYLPNDYTVTFPNFQNEVEMQPGEKFVVLWTHDAPDDDPYLYGFVSFGDALGLQYICVGPNHGVMEIPPEVVDDLTESGFVQHGLLSHRPVAVSSAGHPLNGKRIDLIGISCNESRYIVRRP